MTTTWPIVTAVIFLLGGIFFCIANLDRIQNWWVRFRAPTPPFNYINGVMMPLPGDHRWVYRSDGDVVLSDARIRIHYCHDNGIGSDLFWLYVDGVLWPRSDGYCRAVHEYVRNAHAARRLRESADLVRNNTSQAGCPS